jgi:membrane-bound lytic murein transglycosylase MltF
MASVLAFISALAASPSPSWSQAFSARYDSDIVGAVAKFWPDFPYPLAWKAQLYQESRLNPAAVSPVGARGLAQFMPGTWAEVQRDLGWSNVSPHAERQSIYAGAYYMAKLRKAWKSKRPAWDRQWLAQASYNAGMGNLIRAQKKCGGPNRYDEIIWCLPNVTGHHSKETIDYVERIARWWSRMAPVDRMYRPTIE